MNTKNVILTHRRCRKFIRDKLPPNEVIEDILLAGISATTWIVKFHIVFNNIKLLQSIGEKCFNCLSTEVKQHLLVEKIIIV